MAGGIVADDSYHRYSFEQRIAGWCHRTYNQTIWLVTGLYWVGHYSNCRQCHRTLQCADYCTERSCRLEYGDYGWLFNSGCYLCSAAAGAGEPLLSNSSEPGFPTSGTGHIGIGNYSFPTCEPGRRIYLVGGNATSGRLLDGMCRVLFCSRLKSYSL